MKTLYRSDKHCFEIHKISGNAVLSHPEAGDIVIQCYADLTNEAQMDRFKKIYNGQVDLHNKTNVDHRRGLPVPKHGFALESE